MYVILLLLMLKDLQANAACCNISHDNMQDVLILKTELHILLLWNQYIDCA